MWDFGKIITAACFLVVSQSSCSSVTPHENFIMTMKADIGKNLDNPALSGWMQPARLIDYKTLPNGDIEYAYRFRGNCRYFYEVDPKTRKIIGWRFEGGERDCIINP